MTKHEPLRSAVQRDLCGRAAAIPLRTPNAAARDPQAMRAIPVVEETLDSRDVFAAARVVSIAHGEQVYQLRLTAQNKLILTK